MTRRALLLLACVTGGALAGWIAWLLTGSDRGFLAIPAAMAVGWWWLADPTACDPTACDPAGDDTADLARKSDPVATPHPHPRSHGQGVDP